MQGIFQKENTDKALKYGIYRHLPTYEKIIRNLVSFSKEKIYIANKKISKIFREMYMHIKYHKKHYNCLKIKNYLITQKLNLVL
jgi:hypothetical protein